VRRERVEMAEEVVVTRDVVIVGGGATGLSAALTLARARRRVTVVDAGAPRNAPADGVHGLLALEGVSPAELLRVAATRSPASAGRSSQLR
jgi:thioredoxin reductase